MKKLKKGILVLLLIFVLVGCKDKYNSITHTSFVEFFNNKDNFIISDRTIDYQDTYQRCYEVSNGNVQFLYYEFKTFEEGNEYLKNNYYKRDNYNLKLKNDYAVVYSNSKGYFYGVLVDNVLIVGNTENSNYKKEIKNIFKELGY